MKATSNQIQKLKTEISKIQREILKGEWIKERNGKNKKLLQKYRLNCKASERQLTQMKMR